MEDRSSRPRASPGQTPKRRERRIIALRVNRRWGPDRIGYKLGMHPSTVHRVLSRSGLAKLTWQDRATGRTIRRYEHEHPGDLVHVDIKKLGRIPDGGGHKVLGRAAGRKNKTRTDANRRPGYAYLHNAVDDHSRLAYTEILTDEKQETAAGFWQRANAYFESRGVTVQRVLTDNGSCYRSKLFAKALGPGTQAQTHQPYRPQTNGKVERFNRTMLEEWAYAMPYAQRPNASRLRAPGCTITITTEATPHSKVTDAPPRRQPMEPPRPTPHRHLGHPGTRRLRTVTIDYGPGPIT